MAKIGLNFGDKLQIADKEYRVVSEGLNVQALLGNLSWRRFEEPIFFTEPDETKQPDRYGNYPEIPTGEVKWNDIAVFSSAQGQTVFVSIADMSQHEIEELGLKLGDEIELTDVVVTYSYLNRGDVYKLFASKVVKKGQGQKPKQEGKKEG
ncbi:hypothetical protein [Streptococcus ferus]|uniref:hypothetical protein n=1 Tax=Streptococcus ferus TaxID=1345 RepID=UPI0023541D87|nr:hypothetical protein [Streptococcus ferus]